VPLTGYGRELRRSRALVFAVPVPRRRRHRYGNELNSHPAPSLEFESRCFAVIHLRSIRSRPSRCGPSTARPSSIATRFVSKSAPPPARRRSRFVMSSPAPTPSLATASTTLRAANAALSARRRPRPFARRRPRLDDFSAAIPRRLDGPCLLKPRSQAANPYHRSAAGPPPWSIASHRPILRSARPSSLRRRAVAPRPHPRGPRRQHRRARRCSGASSSEDWDPSHAGFQRSVKLPFSSQLTARPPATRAADLRAARLVVPIVRAISKSAPARRRQDARVRTRPRPADIRSPRSPSIRSPLYDPPPPPPKTPPPPTPPPPPN